jgi:hypothetical protein
MRRSCSAVHVDVAALPGALSFANLGVSFG